MASAVAIRVSRDTNWMAFCCIFKLYHESYFCEDVAIDKLLSNRKVGETYSVFVTMKNGKSIKNSITNERVNEL